MPTQSDAQLLRAYAELGDEASFTELVARNANLVNAAALRQTASPDAATDVAQKVFIALAHGAKTLTPKLALDASLAGWLCRSARNISLNLRRDESHRRYLERHVMPDVSPVSQVEIEPDWDHLRPVLDEAMSDLTEQDYDALVMRFFNNEDFRSIGKSLGASDDTAQKRVARALEKLREHLSKRGITTTSAALSLTISANAFQTAPTGLAVSLSTAAFDSVKLATLSTPTLKIAAMTTLQKTAVAAGLAFSIGLVTYEARQSSFWRNQALASQQQEGSISDHLAQSQREHDDLTNRLALLDQENSALKNSASQFAQLRSADAQATNDPAMMALAANVSLLKRKLEEMPDKKIPELQFVTAKDWADAAADEDLSTDDGVRDALSKLRESAINTFLNNMMQGALNRYLAANGNVLPTDLTQLKPYFNVPVTDAMLQRYSLLQSGVNDPSSDAVTLTASSADADYDSNHSMSTKGASGGRFNRVRDAVGAAAASFALDNNGQNPSDPSQIISYLKTSIDPATIQKYLTPIQADPPPPEILQVMPAITAFRDANNGQVPQNELQILPYLTTPEEQSAFLRFENLPPQALDLAPAFQAFATAHNGAAPTHASDLTPYFTTPDQQAALQLVMQRNKSFLKP